MGVMANVRDKLGAGWARIKAWAKSVPPDVWIGLAIAAATLIVVWMAYRRGGGSTTDSGSITGDSSGAGANSGSLPTLPTIPDNPFTNPFSGGNGGGGSKKQRAGPMTITLDPWTPRKQQQGLDLQAYWKTNAIINSASQQDESTIAKTIQKQTPATIKAAQHQGAIVHSADIHSASQAITHALAKPPTGHRQDVVY